MGIIIKDVAADMQDLCKVMWNIDIEKSLQNPTKPFITIKFTYDKEHNKLERCIVQLKNGMIIECKNKSYQDAYKPNDTAYGVMYYKWDNKRKGIWKNNDQK